MEVNIDFINFCFDRKLDIGDVGVSNCHHPLSSYYKEERNKSMEDEKTESKT